jgi:hypothetical protein
MGVPGGVGDEAWSLWQIFVTLVSGGALTSSLGFIFWTGRKLGQGEMSMTALRRDFEDHGESDERTFAAVEQKIERLRMESSDVKQLISDRPSRSEFLEGIRSIQQSISAMGMRIDSAFRREQ